MINLTRLVSLFVLLTLFIGKNNVRSYPIQHHYQKSIVTALKHLKENLYSQPKAFLPGIYPGYEHTYFFGTIDQIYRREIYCVFNDNSFFTGYVIDLLLEAYGLTFGNDDDEKLDISDASIEESMKTTLNYFQDTLYGPNVPVINYYPLKSTDINTFEASDFDCSSLQIFVYAKLKEFKSAFPNSYSTISHTDPQLVMPLFEKYSYQPFSQDINHNTIDPRTYYWLRHFIDDYMKQQGNADNNKKDLMFIGTYTTNHDESLKKGPVILGSTNVVDVAVVTNSILGIVTTILTNPLSCSKWADKSLLRLLTISTKLIKWVIDTNWINKRPDLVLVYYPSLKVYYWFLSRVINYLTNADLDYFYHNNRSVYNTLSYVRDTLTRIMRKKITKQFIHNIKRNGQWIYYDDFLGYHDDVDYHEDRLYTTSTVVDLLINTWTKKTFGSKVSLEWVENTPAKVMEIVKHASIFINDHITDRSYPKEQAFSSLSFTNKYTHITDYPSTYFCYFNGTCRNSTNLTIKADYGDGLHSILVVNHPIDNKKYEKLLSEHAIFDNMPEYVNQWNESDLIYDSSPALTYAISVLALVKSRALLNEYCSDNADHNVGNHDSNSCLDDEESFHTQELEMEHENDNSPGIAAFSAALDLKCNAKFCYYKQYYLPLE